MADTETTRPSSGFFATHPSHTEVFVACMHAMREMMKKITTCVCVCTAYDSCDSSIEATMTIVQTLKGTYIAGKYEEHIIPHPPLF